MMNNNNNERENENSYTICIARAIHVLYEICFFLRSVSTIREFFFSLPVLPAFLVYVFSGPAVKSTRKPENGEKK